jgi:tRNA(Ser,Leu) C12 N-acetylase TAN1
MLDAIERKTAENTALYDAISRVAPATRTTGFRSVDEFMQKLRAILLEWLPHLMGRSFHVRLHRRGGRHDLRTPEVERSFDQLLLDATAAASAPSKISFTDPDAVIAIDTIDDRAGIGLWTRGDFARHRLLWPD